MIRAYISALRQLSDPPVKRVILRVGLWTAVLYLLVGIALWSALTGIDPAGSFDFIPIVWLKSFMAWIAGIVVGLLGIFAFFTIFWLLFVGIVQLIAGFYLEDIIAAVEARHFPDLPPATGQTALGAAINSLRYFGILVLLNLLALPFYLIPLFGIVLFYLVNGYLMGREYFELAVLRRVDARAARILRKTHGGRIFGAGVIATVLFSLPIFNLAAPILATAAMVHIIETLPGRRIAREADDV